MNIKKIKFFDVIAIISMAGIIAWQITDFFGGMFIFLLSYSAIILPIIILYIISFFETIISIIKRGVKNSKIKLIAHTIVLIAIIIFNLYHSELFKSKPILKAILRDDLFHHTLIFRENGKVENQIQGMFGYEKTYKGIYHFKEDTIIFSKKPYDNDFIPDTLLIDKYQNVIFMYKDKNGHFNKEIEWLNHFKIIN